MAALIFERCDEDVIREVFQRKMPSKWRRFRSCMTKVLDQYYFKELPPEELKKQLDLAVVTRHDIKNMDQVSELM